MLLKLEEPFKSKWKFGYLVTQNERVTVRLRNNEREKKSISYARYLMSVKLGYEVPDEYEVDHRDNDRTNDDIHNLQLLTVDEHRIKTGKEKTEAALIELTCPLCKKMFRRLKGYVEFRKKMNQKITCSRICSGKLGNSIPSRMLSLENISFIKTLKSQGQSDYEIRRITGYSRNTIAKYRKEA